MKFFLASLDSSYFEEKPRFHWLYAATGNFVYGKKNEGCKEPTTYSYGPQCICQCVEGKWHVFLGLTRSDILWGRVITGIRFQTVSNGIAIRIKQGTLAPNGTIVQNSTEWKPLSLKDFDRLSLNDKNKAFNLDNLMGNDDEVLTGIGFTRSHDDANDKVQLQIEVTKFQYSTGRMYAKSRNISATNRHDREAKVGDYDSVDRKLENQPHPTFRDTISRYHVKFRRSDLDQRSDAGQTTLPHFDSVPVEGSPPCPLSGAGLFHKNTPRTGGFLSLKVFVINYGKYFGENVKALPVPDEK